VAMFQTIGLPQALVQREVIDEDHKAAAFWTTMVMGFVLAGVIILLAGPAAVFFKEEAVRPVMHLMSVTMVLGSAASVPRALLERRIDFKRLFWPDLIGAAVYGGVGITMAVLGYAYWSLAWGAVARGAATLVLVTTMARYAPRLACRRESIHDLLHYGAPVTVATFTNWVAQNVDYFIVGRWASTTLLGIYRKSYEWTTAAIRYVAQPAGNVMFPSLARLQQEPGRARYALDRYVSGLAMLTLGPLVVLSVTAPELVPAVFGEQWRDAIVPTQILCAMGFLRVLMWATGTAVRSHGYVAGHAVTGAMYAILIALGTALGLRWGAVGVATGVVVATVINTVMMGYLLWLCLGWRVRDYVSALWQSALAGTTCGGAGLAMRAVLLAAGAGTEAVAAAAAAAAAAAYVSVLVAVGALNVGMVIRETREVVSRLSAGASRTERADGARSEHV